ncbi:MAG: glycosyltransferase, partial [Candidatus Eisenbacteria bacterium]
TGTGGTGLPGWFLEGGPVVTFVGRLRRAKGPDVFLKAASIVLRARPDARFLVVGEGPMRAELLLLSHELGLERSLQIPGNVRCLKEVLERTTVFVCSSRTEGFPTVLMEAMGAGVPVVAARVGGVVELVEEGVDGFLFESEDSGALASIVVRLLSDGETASRAALKGREKVLSRFRFEDTVSRMEALYERLLTSLPPRPVKVLLAVARARIAGTERHVLELARAFDSCDIEVSVLVLEEGELVERLREEGIPCRVIKKRARLDFLLLFRLVSFLGKNPFDVVHGHPERIACLASRLAAVPAAIMTYHSVGPLTGERRPGRLHVAVERLRARVVDCTVAVSAEDARVLVEKFGKRPGEVRLIANGIALSPVPEGDKARVAREFGFDASSRLICTTARLTAQKGVEFLIRAAKRVTAEFPDSVFLLLGDGELRNELEELSRSLGLGSRVLFPGHREDALELVAASDVFVLPSLWEGMAYSLLEAMLVSRPIVATTVSRDVLSDGETGLMVPPGDADALASAITRLLSDRSLAVRLGEAARRRLEERFSAPRMAAETARLYDEVLAAKPGRKPGRKAGRSRRRLERPGSICL